MDDSMDDSMENELLNSGDEIEVDDGFPAFDIQLGPTGDTGSGFHTQKDPRNLYQRDSIINREGAINIQGSCVDIIHGIFAQGSEYFCTLLVLQFRFDPRKRARRIAQVDIELRFAGKDASTADPDVYAIAPDGRFSFAQTSQSETRTLESDVHIGGGGAGVDAGGALKYRRNISRHMNYATTITGSTALRGRNYGKPNAVSWTLMENPETKAGVPIAMKTAILLKRRDEGEFQCVVSLKAKADWRTSLTEPLESLFGATTQPWLIDPTQDSTSEKYKEKESKLEEVDLEAVSDITMMNVVEGVVKSRKIGIGDGDRVL